MDSLLSIVQMPAGIPVATMAIGGAVNAALLFVLLWRLTGALWPAALVSALFAWHPLRVESVAWVSERKDVLSLFFFLLTLLAYARYVQATRVPEARAGRFLALAVVFFALGLLAKPMLVTLPCVLLLLDVWPLRRTAFLPTVEAGVSGTPAPLIPPRAGPVPESGRRAVRSPGFSRSPVCEPAKAGTPNEAQIPGPGSATASLPSLLLEKIPLFALVLASSGITFLFQRAVGARS